MSRRQTKGHNNGQPTTHAQTDGRPHYYTSTLMAKPEHTTHLNCPSDRHPEWAIGLATAQDFNSATRLMACQRGGATESLWENLPSDIWRSIILNHLSDRDLGSCLLTAPCFHVLSKGDVSRRRYVHATITGMCAAGDIDGLEYLVGRLTRTAGAPEPPIEDQGRAAVYGHAPGWDACLFEAAIMSQGDVIRWLARRGYLAGCLPYTWRVARGAAAVAADDDTLCALAAAHLTVRGYPYRDRSRRVAKGVGDTMDVDNDDDGGDQPLGGRDDWADMYLRDDRAQPYRAHDRDPWSDIRRRFDTIWQEDTLAERRQDLIKRHQETCGDWDSEMVREVDEEFRDATAEDIALVIQQEADEKRARDAGLIVEADRHARALAYLPRAVFVGMIKRGMLDDAVRVALCARFWSHEAISSWTWDALAEAAARANRVDLMRAMGLVVVLDPDTGDWVFARCDGPGEEWLPECIVSGAVRGGHVDLLDRALRAWDPFFALRGEFFFEAVASGRVDAVRWLHAHGANVEHRRRYGVRAYPASPLTVAIAQGTDDIIAFLLGLPEARDLVRDAFDDAIEIGDMRTARRLYAAHGPMIDDRPPMVALTDDTNNAYPQFAYRQ
ncbi:ankyrin repeat domain containing protein [Pandoravirus celtis]|uniref:Ankyrin repeat domain containing protein n=1 Tax=Pandoravirus celtis TaxID=2568002 RepID=A0A4D6EFS2_9VIRU|nr:ankyrin repeat domain containing protein [Pandoravirus celtis]